MIAIEYEFYLVDARTRTATGCRNRRKGPLTGRREFRTQINSMTDLNEYSPLLAEIDRVCRQQNVPATSALAEYGPGQYEVNLAHAPDALRVCDEALRFKRMVKSVARAHGCDATFLPKPYRDMAGSGLHVHVSLLDKSGRNIFAAAIRSTARRCATRSPAPWPRSATAWRCARRARIPIGASAPRRTCRCMPTWSINNRGSAIRVPASDAANLRIEHRLAGADANPYLVVAWVLAGIHHGLTRGLEPPPVTTGNAYEQPGEPLPIHWSEAIERFARSEFARSTTSARSS